ncbi:MAG TPA: DUF2007 domain-containing protein [Vicinamibacterales bacterium]|nr:DUF2007 domain-containing protein [Vicinamibacterales bacterium]
MCEGQNERQLVADEGQGAHVESGWREVRSCNWLHEALFLKSVLEAEGIDVLIPDEHTLGVQPLYAPALGGVRVLVPAADHARAAEVLAPVDAPGPDVGQDAGED